MLRSAEVHDQGRRLDQRQLLGAGWRRDRRLQEHARAANALPRRLGHARGDPPAIDLLAQLDRLELQLRPGLAQHVEDRVHDLRPDPVATGQADSGLRLGEIRRRLILAWLLQQHLSPHAGRKIVSH
mgnify:CR=1 FL=1